MTGKIVTIKPGQRILIKGASGIDTFVKQLSNWAMPQRGGAAEVHIRALANLIGITDTEAVKIANAYARDHGFPTITTEAFRKWLPTALSAIFTEWKENAP